MDQQTGLGGSRMSASQCLVTPPLPLFAPFAPLGGCAVAGRKDAVIDRARLADQAGSLELGLRDKSDHFTHACSRWKQWIVRAGNANRMPNHPVIPRGLRSTHIRSATGQG